MHPDDQITLEDERGRVKVLGDVVLPSEYVTGLYQQLNFIFVLFANNEQLACDIIIKPLLLNIGLFGF